MITVSNVEWRRCKLASERIHDWMEQRQAVEVGTRTWRVAD